MTVASVEMPADAPVQPLVVFTLDAQRYALALAHVLRSIRVVAITPVAGAPAIVLGIVDIGGQVMPVMDMRGRFGHPARDIRLSDHLLIAGTRNRTIALLVDETVGVIEPAPDTIAPAGEFASRPDLVSGTVKLPDGLILIVDLDRLLEPGEQVAIEHAVNAVVGVSESAEAAEHVAT